MVNPSDVRIRVAVTDDHPVVREGLTSLLARGSDLDVVGSFASAEEMLMLIGSSLPDVLLLDHSLPGISGATACRMVKERWPEIATIILTSSESDHVLRACLEGQARGFLLKAIMGNDLIDAVRTVGRGGTVLAPEITDRVVRWARCAPVVASKTGEAIGSHEVAALSLASRGLSNRGIAREMSVSVGSVKLYLASVMRKLGASERAQAVAAGIQEGII